MSRDRRSQGQNVAATKRRAVNIPVRWGRGSISIVEE
jgi:hypothetical protein